MVCISLSLPTHSLKKPKYPCKVSPLTLPSASEDKTDLIRFAVSFFSAYKARGLCVVGVA